MKSDRRTAVAIVGGGFSGTMAAAHLAGRGIPVLIIEPRDVAGRGTAFSTPDPAHLLNVPAGNMSAWPDRPEDFAARCGDGSAFAERRMFGDYLGTILEDAVGKGAQVQSDRAVRATRRGNGWTVELESGGAVEADALVLAAGNLPPAPLPFAGDAGELLIANPWGADARRAIRRAAAEQLDVLIVGTGLTMVDVVLSLDAAGHRAGILAVSRRGLIPRSHEAGPPAPVAADELPEPDAIGILSWLRKRSGAIGWRAAVDSLRPHSQRLWQALGPAQQSRFLRHARPWWDVHRHRIAPQVAATLQSLTDEGRLRVVAGRIERIERMGHSLDVTVRQRGEQATSAAGRFAYMFNCTGPLGRIEQTSDPLLRQMLDQGLVGPDELGIGLEVDERSRALPAERLWALGALTKGRFWEMIAVPDIRVQAAEIAADIAAELGR